MDFRPSALDIAADLAKSAMRAALANPEGKAARSYLSDFGPVVVRAVADSWRVETNWFQGDMPITRAAAEDLIEARIASRMGGRA